MRLSSRCRCPRRNHSANREEIKAPDSVARSHPPPAAVLYGDPNEDTLPSLLTNDARDRLLFGSAGTCFARRGCVGADHPWYPRVTSGLDALAYHFQAEAKALAEEPAAALTAANPHFDFVAREPNPHSGPRRTDVWSLQNLVLLTELDQNPRRQ